MAFNNKVICNANLNFLEHNNIIIRQTTEIIYVYNYIILSEIILII